MVDLFWNCKSGCWDLIKKLLDQTKKAKPSADESSHYKAYESQISHNIKGEFPLSPVKNRLHRADRAGAQGARAGIAVHAGYTDLFQITGVDR